MSRFRAWDELSDDEKERFVYRAALRFLDDPRRQKYTPALLRESGIPLWGMIADAMDAETAARAARGTLRVARVADD